MKYTCRPLALLLCLLLALAPLASALSEEAAQAVEAAAEAEFTYPDEPVPQPESPQEEAAQPAEETEAARDSMPEAEPDDASLELDVSNSEPEDANLELDAEASSDDGPEAEPGISGESKVEVEPSDEAGAAPAVAGAKPRAVKFAAGRRSMGAPDGGHEDSLQLEVVLDPPDAATGLRFSSSKASVASVDAQGVVTAHAQGSATITVRTDNGKKASVKIRVKRAPASVTLSGCAAELGEGEAGKLLVAFDSGNAGGGIYSLPATRTRWPSIPRPANLPRSRRAAPR